MLSGIIFSALIIGSMALLLSCIALSIIVGLKNSTHQVVWKEIEPKKEVVEEDPFSHVEDEIATLPNINKRIKKSEGSEWPDINDPAETSNNW